MSSNCAKCADKDKLLDKACGIIARKAGGCPLETFDVCMYAVGTQSREDGCFEVSKSTLCWKYYIELVVKADKLPRRVCHEMR